MQINKIFGLNASIVSKIGLTTRHIVTDFYEKISALSKRSQAAEKHASTEEATKTAVILPFIQALGFDVFNLEEVVPEYVADVGTKKGEKVDFAIRIDGKVAILIEAKPIGSKLGEAQFNQLYRYFSVTDARLGVLINGREAWFFSDTDAPNKMDKKPFFKFDLQEHEKSQVEELAKFQKQEFEIETIIEAASNLKYTRAAANFLKAQLANPDDDFVRLIGRNIYDGSITKAVAEQLRPSIQSSLDEIIRDRIQDRLGVTFLSEPQRTSFEEDLGEGLDVDDGGIVTTEEEVQGHLIVRAIGAKVSGIDRINMRDSKSYCAILMDDNNRKPICRFYFNSPTTKYIGIFDENKNETKHKVDDVNELYEYSDQITAAISNYL